MSGTTKTITEELSQIVSGDGREELKQVIDKVHDGLKDLEVDIKKRIITLLTAAFIYELLSTARVSQVSLSGVTLSDFSMVQRIGPVGLSYIYLTLVTLIATRRIAEEVYDRAFSISYPNLYAVDFERILRPHQSFKTFMIIFNHIDGIEKTLLTLGTYAAAITLILAPPALILYSYVQCALKYGVLDPVTIVSAFVSATLLIHTSLVFWTSDRAL